MRKWTTLPRWHRFISGLALCLLLIVPPVAGAGEVRHLYRAEIPVQGQDARERSQAIQQGLRRVLIRVSGKRDIDGVEAVQQALAGPLRFVQQFRYHRMDEPQLVLTESGDEVTYQEWLRLDFDEQSVNMMLREAGLPIWGRARPSILLWVAVEDWNQRKIVGGSIPEPERVTLETIARERGVPTLFPLLDLQDQSSLRFADIWGDFQGVIHTASSRYQPGGIAVGRVYRHSDEEWQGRWTLYQDGHVMRWLVDGESEQDVLAAGFNVMADKLGEQFSQLAGQEGNEQVEVIVTDIRSLEQYARAMRYLESIDVVNDVHVAEVGLNHTAFLLSLRGQSQSFEQAIVFGETLAPDNSPRVSKDNDMVVSDDVNDGTRPTVLQYRLLQ